jgi:hypothetical protein
MYNYYIYIYHFLKRKKQNDNINYLKIKRMGFNCHHLELGVWLLLLLSAVCSANLYDESQKDMKSTSMAVSFKDTVSLTAPS